MPKLELQTQNARFVTKHRAVCEEGDYTGGWRADFDLARGDAIRHMKNNDGHVAYVETKQEQIILTHIN